VAAVSRPSARGFSVVELVVALALTAVVAAAAAELIMEAVRITEAAGRSLRSPSLVLAVVSVRRDVEASVGLLHPPSVGWTQEDLELVGWDGTRMRLHLEGRDLVRAATDELGRWNRRRVLARGVASWWWRSPRPGVIDVRITALVHPAPGIAASSQRARRTEVRRFAFRGWPGGRSW
jgi:prepilin-type N-terminal cleavage/methylation domain-containing protein